MKKIFIMIITAFLSITILSMDVNANSKSRYNDKEDYQFKEIKYTYTNLENKGIDDVLSVDLNNAQYNLLLGDYAFYNVINYSIKGNYYVSPMENKAIDNYILVGLVIIPKYTNHNYYYEGLPDNQSILEILYEVDNELYIKYYTLQDDVLEYINQKSEMVYDITDDSELSNELLNLLNYERHYLLEQLNVSTMNINDTDLDEMMEEQNRSGYCNSAGTVQYKEFDDFTSNKGALNIFLNDSVARNYYKQYYYNMTNDYHASDTMITYLIPRRLFVNVGIYSYIGTAYGFFVRTAIASNDYTSEFIIFSINQTKKSTNENGVVEVKPVFKGYVECVHTIGFISEIIPGSNLVLKDINFDVMIYNKNEPNIGDLGYSFSDDTGYYINSYSTYVNVKAPSNSTISLKYIRYFANLFSYIPKYGTALKWTTNAATYLIEFIYNSSQPDQSINMSSVANYNDIYDGTSYWASTATTPSEMINVYGNIVRGINANLKDVYGGNNESILYYDVNDQNCFKVTYSLGQLNNSIVCDSVIQTKIELSIYESNHLNTLIDYVTNSWGEEYNQHRQSSTHTIYVDTPTEVEYVYNGYQLYNFTPISTANYEIETYGTNYNTYLELYLGNNLLTTDDDSGLYVNSNNQSICSKINLTLNANNTYTIKVRGYNNSGGHTYLIVKRYGSNLTEQITSSGYSHVYGYSIWQKFIPTRNDIYDFFTVSYNDIVDTYIELYDSNHNLIAFSDSYDDTHHGKISLYLEQGVTYFVKTRHQGSIYSERSFGVIVAREEEIESTTSNQYYYTWGHIEKGVSDVIIYHFKPLYTSDYKFYTTFSNGKKDVVMYLFDEEFNQIAYDDDSNGNFQPKIIYNCLYYKTYYIMIKHYSASNGEYTWFNFYARED